MGTYYDVLGVNGSASAEDIKAAYRELARAFQSDRHATGTDQVRQHAESVMASVNEAYRILGDASLRAEYDANLRAQRQAPPRVATPMRDVLDDECVLCGSHPSTLIRVEQNTGMLFQRRVRRFEAEVCQPCGLEIVRSMTSRTLVTGWWGIISLFANMWSLVVNFLAWRYLSKLDHPSRRTDAVILTPLSSPMPAGKPLWQRAGFLAFAAVVALYIVSASQTGDGASDTASRTAASAGSSGNSATRGFSGASSSNGYSPREPDVEDLEGWCLTYAFGRQRIDGVVPCWQSHDAKVVEVTNDPDRCPWSSSHYFEVPDGFRSVVLCVDG